jgi:ribosomal protein S18 acetylase RimI-like enzyme
MHGLVVRLAGQSDIEACVALAIQTAHGDADMWREALRRDLERPEHLLVVATIDVEIAAYGRARLFEPAADAPTDSAPYGYYLTGVFVQPARRGEGLAAALTEARLRWISEQADEAWYFANARNSASIELHRRFGFEEVTRHFSFPGLAFEGGEGILFRADLHALGRAPAKEPQSAW